MYYPKSLKRTVRWKMLGSVFLKWLAIVMNLPCSVVLLENC